MRWTVAIRPSGSGRSRRCASWSRSSRSCTWTTPDGSAGRGRPSPTDSGSPASPSTRSITCADGAGGEASLFERCDPDTMTVFDSAVAEARRRGHNYIGTEHLLLSLAQHRDLLPDEVAALMPGDDVIAAALDAALDSPSSTADGELL